MKDKCHCYWCEKKIEYDFVNDAKQFFDENMNGDVIDWYEIICPHCGKYTRID